MTTAHQVNPVVISIEVIVLDLVLENRVNMMTTAHQENLVVIVVKTLLANVLDLVLENRVNLITTAV
jgi:hypothetical protein